MSRMDKYEENEEKVLSRTRKNEDLYKDVYLNNTLVDLAQIINEEEVVSEEDLKDEVIEFETINYVEKNYSLSDYLNEKRKEKIQDNLPRSLSESLKESDDEISQLLLKIEQKDNHEELFKELLPDDGETTILEPAEDNLNNFVSDETINNFVMNKELDETTSFMDLEETKIIETKKIKYKKNKKLPLIVFSITLLILVGLIVYLLVRNIF